MLDRLIKISSLAGAMLIFFGVLKLIIFYSNFNITIIDFLTFSEIITSFLDDINILLIFAVIMTLVSVLTLDYFHRQTKSDLDQFFNDLEAGADLKKTDAAKATAATIKAEAGTT